MLNLWATQVFRQSRFLLGSKGNQCWLTWAENDFCKGRWLTHRSNSLAGGLSWELRSGDNAWECATKLVWPGRCPCHHQGPAAASSTTAPDSSGRWDCPWQSCHCCPKNLLWLQDVIWSHLKSLLCIAVRSDTRVASLYLEPRLCAQDWHFQLLLEKGGFVSYKIYQLKSKISPKNVEKKQLRKTNTNINKMKRKDKIDLIFEKTIKGREKHILGLKKKEHNYRKFLFLK